MSSSLAPEMLQEWMNQAMTAAEHAGACDEVPVGAVIVEKNTHRMIAKGFNLRESHQDPTAHAEMLAIKNASKALKTWRLTDCILVVTLEPCPMCLAAAQQARVCEVIYGAKDPKGGALSLGYSLHEDKRTNHRFPVTFHNDPKCSEILSEFFKKKRQKK